MYCECSLPTWLSNMINDANHFASLLETKDYEDFLTKIVD